MNKCFSNYFNTVLPLLFEYVETPEEKKKKKSLNDDDYLYTQEVICLLQSIDVCYHIDSRRYKIYKISGRMVKVTAMSTAAPIT